MTQNVGMFTLHDKQMPNVEGPQYVHSLGLKAYEPYGGRDLAKPDRDVARRIRDEADRLGVTLPCMSVSVDLCGERGPWGAEHLMRFAELAKEMGIPLLHHTLHHELNPDAQLPQFEDALAELLPRVREVFDHAASLGVTCVYEDQGQVVNGCDRFERFLKALDRPAGVVLDLGNTVFAGETADAFAERFLDRIVHVHVKDFHVRPYAGEGYRLRGGLAATQAMLGEGDTRALEALKILKNRGYDGWYMLECEPIRDAREEFPGHLSALLSVIG